MSAAIGTLSRAPGPAYLGQIPYPKAIDLSGQRFGLAGEYIRLVAPHTEADPYYMLSYFLCCFGNVIGRGPHMIVGGDHHHTNLYICAVGPTAKGRKGSAAAPVELVFKAVAPDWSKRIQAGGLSSGEGIIQAVHDDIHARIRNKKKGTFEDVITDPGVADKRLFIRQPELDGALQSMKRNGNILSSVIRDGWDRGDLNTLTKNPLKATDAHISIVANITREELLANMSSEIDNGFANRFIWNCSTRSKWLPSGGHLSDVDLSDFKLRLIKAIDFAKGIGEVKRDRDADELWGRDNSNNGMYAKLSAPRRGLCEIVTARAAPQVLRLALNFAMLGSRDKITVTDLEDAREMWRYSEDSSRYIFGEALSNSLANDILEALKNAPEGLSRNHIFTEVCGKNKSSANIQAALAQLAESGLAKLKPQHAAGGRKQAAGRPPEIWIATE